MSKKKRNGRPVAAKAKRSGLLGKLGNFAKKTLGKAAKIIPGPLGMAAKVISSVGNDPEWWQHPLGNGVTTNMLMQSVSSDGSAAVPASNPIAPYERITHLRPAIVAFDSSYTIPVVMLDPTQSAPVGQLPRFATQLSTTQLQNWLLPSVRKVLNAIPLQTFNAYMIAYMVQTTRVALYHTLQKFKRLMDLAASTIPSLADGFSDIFLPNNYAQLNATIEQLRRTINSSIRLPHTLTMYLEWRFGRVFKSNQSEKSSFVIYNAIPIHATLSDINDMVQNLSHTLVSDDRISRAAVDIFMAYKHHTQHMDTPSGFECRYDAKEFVLRTNSDYVANWAFNPTTDVIAMDTELPIAETFTASVVSTRVTNPSNMEEYPVGVAIDNVTADANTNVLDNLVLGRTGSLFPISDVAIYFAAPGGMQNWLVAGGKGDASWTASQLFNPCGTSKQWTYTWAFSSGTALIGPEGATRRDTVDVRARRYDSNVKVLATNFSSTFTAGGVLTPTVEPATTEISSQWQSTNISGNGIFMKRLIVTAAFKAADCYNMSYPLTLAIAHSDSFIPIDMTAISINAGFVQDFNLYAEQLMGAANLLNNDHTRSKDVRAEVIEETEAFMDNH